MFFKVFGVQILPREPQEAQEGSQEAPKELQSCNKKGSKNRPKIYMFGPLLAPFRGPFWDPKVVQKGTNNGTTFGTLSLRISRVREMPVQELNESGEKGTVTEIILSNRKGGTWGDRGS